MVGKKYDQGKPRWSLLPWAAVDKVVRVLTFGATKYGDHNWKHVPEADERYFNAAIRHLTAWQQGEEIDEESGLSHLAHAATCILFLLDLQGGQSSAMDGTERDWRGRMEKLEDR